LSKLNNSKEKEAYIFSAPEDIENIDKYFLNNIGSTNIMCPNMGYFWNKEFTLLIW